MSKRYFYPCHESITSPATTSLNSAHIPALIRRPTRSSNPERVPCATTSDAESEKSSPEFKPESSSRDVVEWAMPRTASTEEKPQQSHGADGGRNRVSPLQRHDVRHCGAIMLVHLDCQVKPIFGTFNAVNLNDTPLIFFLGAHSSPSRKKPKKAVEVMEDIVQYSKEVCTCFQ